MIKGIHTIIYTKNPEQLRAFFRDVLGMRSVDAGENWLIFALPPAELAAHPSDENNRHEIYLMCDDVQATVEQLTTMSAAQCSPIVDRGWGLLTTLTLPGGDEIGLYQPKHPMAISSGK